MLLELKAIVLIDSAIHQNKVKPLLSKLAALTLVSVIKTPAGKESHPTGQMFADSDPDFIRAICKYIPTWPGYAGPAGIVYRIHGKTDHVIKCPKTSCTIIGAAGHLLAVTRPRGCANFLRQFNFESLRFEGFPLEDSLGCLAGGDSGNHSAHCNLLDDSALMP